VPRSEEGHASLFGDRCIGLRLAQRRRRRLFDHHVKTVLQRLFNERQATARRRADGDRLHLRKRGHHRADGSESRNPVRRLMRCDGGDQLEIRTIRKRRDMLVACDLADADKRDR